MAWYKQYKFKEGCVGHFTTLHDLLLRVNYSISSHLVFGFFKFAFKDNSNWAELAKKFF